MNAFPASPAPASFRPSAASRRQARRGAFALVVTLLILSLLIIVAVSYLSSMVNERQTADAYTSKTRAEQAAQAGVDSAIAIMTESFRDFPDSATVWDPQQSQNTGTPSNPAIVNTPYNEGTDLYLRAVADPNTGAANPLPLGIPVPGATPVSASDPGGNDPNNPAGKNFVLPLISGVPGGRAQLARNKASILPVMNLGEPDPVKQNFVDLNVRRYGPNPASTIPAVKQYGDVWGVIGSPPDWTNASTAPVGPKPARALWVNLKDNNGLLTGRYAFWIEDESFRANVNLANTSSANADTASASTRTDNGPDGTTKVYPVDPTTKQPYISSPADAGLNEALTAFDSSSAADVQSVLDVRKVYPGKFLPEPLAFMHSVSSGNGASTLSTPNAEGIRYLTTTQSSALNLTRHGTERLNLNNVVQTVNLSNDQPPYTTSMATMKKQVAQIVQTLQFHLPNFGQRFYRTDSGTTGTTLNAFQVASNIAGVGDPRLIYQYKVAANIRDYIDTDSQPTLVTSTGDIAQIGVPNAPKPVQPFGEDGSANPMWAVGKEVSPFLQETAVRFRPVAPQTGTAQGTYTLNVDFYLEFWNMTDHDIYASPQALQSVPPGSQLPPGLAHLNGAQIRVSNQHQWNSWGPKDPSGQLLYFNNNGVQTPLSNPYTDLTIDLTGGAQVGGGVYLNGVLQDGTNGTSNGVVFRAGRATVITTDPDYANYTFSTPVKNNLGGNGNPYTSTTGHSNPYTTFYCPIVAPGRRVYTGSISNGENGLQPIFREPTTSPPQDYETEITFYNQYGYLDCHLFALSEAAPVYTDTDTQQNQTGSFNDYSYGGSLYGNSIVSQMGDPRTNNEQMVFHRYSGGGALTGDVTRYYNGNHTLGYQNANYVQPLGGAASGFGGTNASSSTTFIPWPDYFNWPANNTDYIDLNAQIAPSVIADKPLASIGQLGDVFDPARLLNPGSIIMGSRGGGRTFKIGQRDDRTTYDPTGSPNPSLDNIPASQAWASWRLADVFSAGPVDPTNFTGPTQDPIELPGRLNINGVLRDNGAALRCLLTNFHFQPATVDPATGTTEPLFHTPSALAGGVLSLQPTATTGVAKLVSQISTRLLAPPSTNNVPWGPFFERGELGELEASGIAIFGKYAPNAFIKSTDLMGPTVDMNHTFDRGREELVRRLSEMICTKGDTFTVYAVGQSLVQHDSLSAAKINGTHRMRVTFRLVPKSIDSNGVFHDFHPGYTTPADGNPTIVNSIDYDPFATTATATTNTTATRFLKPDHYDVQVLEVNTL